MFLRHDIGEFRRNEDGTILVFVGMSIAVILGIVALSFDLGRVAATQSELQSYADTVALAAAAELDGNDDAITRATAAADELIEDSQTFAEGDRRLAGALDYTITFHSTLPQDDQAAIAGDTTDPVAARYARVVLAPRTVRFSLASAFFGLTGRTAEDPVVGAQAVAGYTQYACDITPLMFCIPSSDFDATEWEGRMIYLRAGGSNASWVPGDFGFLDPDYVAIDPAGPCAGLNGAQRDRCLIGAEGGVTQCFSQRGVDTAPGQRVGNTDNFFNIRFDMYENALKSLRNDPNYRPAPNVIRSITTTQNGGGKNTTNGSGGGSCEVRDTVATMALPRDAGLSATSRFGNGVWDRAAYITANHGGADVDPSARSRYQYYLAEIEAAGGGASTNRILPAGRQFTGRPQCAPSQSPDPDRRVLIAAGIDCTAHPIRGRARGVPVHQFVRLFMTEPVGANGAGGFDIMVEVIGPAGGNGGGTGGSDGVFHDVVQLYR
jgi:Flp pilus assembly protein TadG